MAAMTLFILKTFIFIENNALPNTGDAITSFSPTHSVSIECCFDSRSFIFTTIMYYLYIYPQDQISRIQIYRAL